MAKKRDFSSEIEVAEMVLSFNATNGWNRKFNFNHLPQAIKDMCGLHGLKQKLADKTASGEGLLSLQEKCDAIDALWESLCNGSWSQRSEGMSSLLYKALCRVYSKKSPDVVAEFLKTRTEKEKAALSRVPAIAKAIADLQSERASSVDVGGLLEQLDELED